MRATNSEVNRLKRSIVLACSSAGEGHIPSAFSVLDIVWILYNKVLKMDPENPKDDERDRFILSKGHGSLALYSVLADRGFFPMSELDRYAAFDSILGGHPDSNKVPGIEASTGSLGHGLPFGVGVAMGLKIRHKERRVIVLIGDGECNEGSIWESVLLASEHGLENLTCIVDYNHSNDRALKLGDLVGKFSSFGWNSVEIDGHDHSAILAAFQAVGGNKPTAIVAQTTKGFGSRRMENNPAWHHKSPNAEELREILEELK